jgi:hypothetical protein
MKAETTIQDSAKLDITVRPLKENDLSAADKIMRLAFGTFIGLPEPLAFMGDAASGYNRPGVYVIDDWR